MDIMLGIGIVFVMPYLIKLALYIVLTWYSLSKLVIYVNFPVRCTNNRDQGCVSGLYQNIIQ